KHRRVDSRAGPGLQSIMQQVLEFFGRAVSWLALSLRFSYGRSLWASQQIIGRTTLNLRQFVELIGIVSAHSPNLIEAFGPLSRDALHRYSDYSQVRSRNWLSALDELPRELAATPPAFRPAVWQRAEPTFADIFAGGLAARVWGAVLTACSRT